jgi:hypothetical protein
VPTGPLHGHQFEDFDRVFSVALGEERQAVGERFRVSEVVGFDDRVAA